MTCQPSSRRGTSKSIAIVPFPALGDLAIYLRLAQSLVDAGNQVTIYSDTLHPAADLVSWLQVQPLSTCSIEGIAQCHDLLIGDILAKPIREYDGTAEKLAALPNFLAVTAKTFPARQQNLPVPEGIAGISKSSPHRSFCPRQQRGPSMVEWVDRYAQEVLGLSVSATRPPIMKPAGWSADQDSSRRVLIFPTTPNPKKNFHLAGFKRLRDKLVKKGWKVEIVCMSHEQPVIEKVFDPQSVLTFPDIRALILHIMQSRAVISNDSGGGHLASMLGLPTFTITKKREDFVWRPGFNDQGHVISPVMTLKWFSGRIWRPFIPLDKIVRSLSHLPESHR